MKRGRIDLVILAGGPATRMGSLCDHTPKALLPVAGMPFMAWQLAEITSAMPLRRVIVATREGQRTRFKTTFKTLDHTFDMVEETESLGTGGAILNVMDCKPLSDPFLVVNGDVLFRMDVAALRDAARDQGAALAAIHIPDSSRFATVHTMGNQVSGFQEKTGMMVPGLINAGLYAFTHNALAGFARGPSSFERDIAPALVARNQLDAVRMKGPFLDIGTPENYATADNVVKQLVV